MQQCGAVALPQLKFGREIDAPFFIFPPSYPPFIPICQSSSPSLPPLHPPHIPPPYFSSGNLPYLWLALIFLSLALTPMSFCAYLHPALLSLRRPSSLVWLAARLSPFHLHCLSTPFSPSPTWPLSLSRSVVSHLLTRISSAILTGGSLIHQQTHMSRSD